MTHKEAIDLIRPGVYPASGTWADIGAGTGMFTRALSEILEEGVRRGNGENRGNRIYAVDKSPHALWELKSASKVELDIIEADFNNPLNLPPLDGVLMANALHYAQDHLAVLKNVITSLKINGTFILIEYGTEKPRLPWVPFPVSFKMFESLCVEVGLSSPLLIGRIDSRYGFDHIYSAHATRMI